MADEEAAAEGEPATSEDTPEAATDDAAAEEEEEEEDLLSTPAFLKQKLKVLEKELEDVTAKTAEARAESSTIAEEWAQKRYAYRKKTENQGLRFLSHASHIQSLLCFLGAGRGCKLILKISRRVTRTRRSRRS